mmetsp:Transcript_25964/g.53117  ORF Transcript_25964/g.53117 Transcript_25964/m.53117 type:complete len:316 (-) Transcript_25964:28-975(-)
MKRISSRKQKQYLRNVMDKIERNDPSTADVVLNDIEIGNESFAVFVLSLVTNTHIQKLFLHNAGITSTQAHLLACALQQNRSLKHLSLNGNSIGSTGAESLASALYDNPTLKTLGLTNNSIGNLGGKKLLKMLRENESIDEIFLEGNDISNKILIKINDCCRRHHSRTRRHLKGSVGKTRPSYSDDIEDLDSTTYASSDFTSHASRKSESNESEYEDCHELPNFSQNQGTSYGFANISVEDFNSSGLDLASYIKRVNLLSMEATEEEEAFLKEMECSDADLSVAYQYNPHPAKKETKKKSVLKALGSRLSRKGTK